MVNMLKIIYIAFFISLSALMTSQAMEAQTTDFNQQTLSELTLGAQGVLREFGVNNLNLAEMNEFIKFQIIPKHGQEMYTLWQHANNWEKAGIGLLRQTRDNLYQTIAHVSNDKRAKEIIKGKLKDKSFLLFFNLTLPSLKEKALSTIHNGRIKIEKDLRGTGYDLIFQYKFENNIGLSRTKDFKELADNPALSPIHNTKVMVIVIGMYDFLDKLWDLTEKSGMAHESEVRALIPKFPGRIKSIYAIEDYTF